jgi:hypothetical protein
MLLMPHELPTCNQTYSAGYRNPSRFRFHCTYVRTYARMCVPIGMHVCAYVIVIISIFRCANPIQNSRRVRLTGGMRFECTRPRVAPWYTTHHTFATEDNDLRCSQPLRYPPSSLPIQAMRRLRLSARASSAFVLCQHIDMDPYGSF